MKSRENRKETNAVWIQRKFQTTNMVSKYGFSLFVICSFGVCSWKAPLANAKPRQCVDKFEIFRNHTMCLGDPSIKLSHAEQGEIENQLNALRNNVSAKNMMELHYVLPLEMEAQTWADTCSFDHDDPYYRFQPGRYHVGQNIYVGQNMTWNDIFDIWAQENSTFKYNQSNVKTQVSNYTQMVYEGSQLVGCGKKLCPGDLMFYVCNFAPSILDSQINTPYESGAAGQGCHGHFTNETAQGTQTLLYPNLCSCVGKFCTNGGILNLTTCECMCVPGVKTFNSHICELTCTKDGDHNDCASMREADCRSDPMAPFKCPWLCNVCPYSGTGYRQNSVTMPWETTTTSTTQPLSTVKGATAAPTAAATTSAPSGNVTTASPPKGGTPATQASKLLMVVYVLGTIGLFM